MQGEPDESRAVLDSILRPTHRCLHSDATVSGDSGVPLGAIFSPCAVPYGQVPQAETPLPRCKACGSTINWLCPPPVSWRVGARQAAEGHRRCAP